MARLLRIALVVAAVAGAFAGGYLVKNSFSWVAAEPVPVADATPKPTGKAVTQTTVLAHRTVAFTATVRHTRARRDTQTVAMTVAQRPDLAPPPMPAPPAEPSTIILPPTPVGEPLKLEPVDPNDPGLRMVRDAMGIKTTILDRAAPPPLVLADGKQSSEPEVVPRPLPIVGPPKLEAPTRVDLDVPVITLLPQAPKPVPLLNSRAVELDFEVTRAGLSKVKAVELWVTRDGGANWTRTDRMEGARPPFRTRLGSEGEYGFRMVFESEAGMRTEVPKPGQAPDLVMELDTTPPVIQIYRPVAGPPGTIVLRWLATDKNWDPDPSALCLEYSADGQIWERIGNPILPGDRNAFTWTLPAGVPAEVLFRVIARDKAGNVATAVTTEKMSVDLVAPAGKVTAVRAQGWEPEKGPMPRAVRTGPPAAGALPAVLRSVLPVILGSPGLFSSVAGPALPILHAPWEWDVRGCDVPPVVPHATYTYIHNGSGWWYWSGGDPMSGAPAPFVSPKEWVADLMKTHVVDEGPAWKYHRPDPLAGRPLPEMLPEAAERLLGLLRQPVRVLNPGEVECEPMWLAGHWIHTPYQLTRVDRERRQAGEAAFAALTGDGTVARLLTDRDWKPSTARPQRSPRYGSGSMRPFGGRFDAGPGYWGSFPGPGVLLDV